MVSTAVGYALLSLVCASGNDVVFKRYARKERSRGLYVLGIGIVWAALQAAYMSATGVGFDTSPTTLGYGLAAGLLLTASNILLLESLTHIDTSLGSTIYRLNTVGVVILSVMFLHETIGLYKGLGVGAGIGAVLLLYRPGVHGEGLPRRFALFFALAVTASACRATYGVVTKAGLDEGASMQTLLLIGAVCWIVGGAAYALLVERRLRVTRKKAVYALVSGALVFLIVNFLLLAVDRGEASVVIPIANMSFVGALLLSVGLGMESLTRRKVLAVGVAVVSVLLLSLA